MRVPSRSVNYIILVLKNVIMMPVATKLGKTKDILYEIQFLLVLQCVILATFHCTIAVYLLHFAVKSRIKMWLVYHAALTGHIFQSFLTQSPAHAFFSWSGSLITSRLLTACCRIFGSQVTNRLLLTHYF